MGPFRLAAALGCLLLAAPAPAKDPCAGRFLVPDEFAPLVAGGPPPVIDAVVLTRKRVEIASGCGSARVTWHGSRKLAARWRRCGDARRVRLKATVYADCHLMRGQVAARGAAPKPFAAALSTCGDGLVDEAGGERCEPPRLGGCDAHCRRADARCGDGIVDPGEACDDGNGAAGAGCAPDCTCDRGTFPSTWEAIQTLVLDQHGCTNAACHGAATSGGLDLRSAVAWRNLVDVPAVGTFPALDRVEPGDRSRSFLWLKLAKKTLPDEYASVAGAGMPNGEFPALSADELEAMRLWIQFGAPERGTVPGTDGLLATCLPASGPPKIRPLPPPPPGEGIQLQAPPWPIPPRDGVGQNGEDEICYATYYDVSADVPDWARVPCEPFWGTGRTCVAINHTELAQDPNSHHSIIYAYKGRYDVTDPAARFGPFTCRGGEREGEPCDPKAGPAACAPGGGCAGQIVSSIACIDYGPDDGFSAFGLGGVNVPQIGGSQQPHYEQRYPDGVFWTLPLSGVVIWNSHAFNTHPVPTTNQQYYNLSFAPPAERATYLRGIFDLKDIFVQDVPPFESREYCSTHTLPRGARLFELSSHTHKRGALFRIWGPGITPCRPGPACAPEAGPPLVSTTRYNDPIQHRFAAPLALDGEAEASRTFKYCAVFDNGASVPSEVKRRSTTPLPPAGIGLGGPCTDAEVACVNGASRGRHCGGDHARCDSSPGADDGLCDACPIRGGVTTEDEMFILLGSGYCAPGSPCEAAAEF